MSRAQAAPIQSQHEELYSLKAKFYKEQMDKILKEREAVSQAAE